MTLTAGPLTAVYANGALHDLRHNDVPVLSRLYAAVRDENWSTLPGTVVGEEPGPGRLRFTVQHADLFRWNGEITLASTGTLTFAFDGIALRDFWRNRIGFCLLHPVAFAGAACQVQQADTTLHAAHFPLRVCPDQPVAPFTDIVALSPTLPDSNTVHITFSGDVFEMEDQRNWTDASFKTFCTPLRLPYPVLVRAGEQLRQAVSVNAVSRPPGQRPASLIPRVPLEKEGLNRNVIPKALLRVTLFGAPDDPARLVRAVALAAQRGVGLEVALIGWSGAGLPRGLPVERWLVLPGTERVDSAPDHVGLLTAAQPLRASAPVYAGTDSDFLFLNRFPPPPDLCDGVTFAVNPQVHAFEEASLWETLESYPAVLETALALGQGKPVVVSPLTLAPRWNPYAAQRPPRALRLPPDPRTDTDFGRQWLCAAEEALYAAGAHSVTREELLL